MSSSRPFDHSAVPEGPLRTIVDADAPVLVWIVAGSATAGITATAGDAPAGAHRQWELEAGEALWIPGGRRTTVRGSADSCVLPIRLRDADRTAGPAAPARVRVPEHGHDALLAAFTRSLGVLSGGGVRASAVLDGIGQLTPEVQGPVMPRSDDLRRVAEALLDDPACSPSTIGARHGVGTSALARRFQAETGWTPQRWRSRHVLARAAERIRREGSVSAGVAGSSYGTPQAFARAFRREWGIAPRALLTGATAGPTPAPAPKRTTAPPRSRGAAVGRRAATLGPQCTGYHVILWVAAGAATLGVDERSLPLAAGDIACLPAGATVSLHAGASSAVVPLGWLPGGVSLPPGVVARVDSSAHDALIRLSAWAYAGVSPLGAEDPRRTLQAALGVDDPLDAPPEVVDTIYALLAQLADHPEDGRTSHDLAAHMSVDPARLRRAIEALTGTTLPVWRARTRMAASRRMLRNGLPIAHVAQRVGYADVAGFSRAFTRAHGCPPRTFRTLEDRLLPR